jgi:hypothetical protein
MLWERAMPAISYLLSLKEKIAAMGRLCPRVLLQSVTT